MPSQHSADAVAGAALRGFHPGMANVEVDMLKCLYDLWSAWAADPRDHYE
jgi:hypothetical protein